jgi:hypothetical protein
MFQVGLYIFIKIQVDVNLQIRLQVNLILNLLYFKVNDTQNILTSGLLNFS